MRLLMSIGARNKSADHSVLGVGNATDYKRVLQLTFTEDL